MRLIVVLLVFISQVGFGQWKSYILNPNGDTLNRVDMKGKKQGPWSVHVAELRGERGYEEEGYYEDGYKDGLWKKYSLEGVKIAEENYSWGKLNGKQQYFTYNGGLLRVEHWRSLDPKQLYDTVPVYDLKDPNKLVSFVVVKNDGKPAKHGEWIYYNPREGAIEAIEMYRMNKLKTKDGDLDDDDIKPIETSIAKAKSDTAAKKIAKKPQAILDYEKKNAGKKKIKSRDGSTN